MYHTISHKTSPIYLTQCFKKTHQRDLTLTKFLNTQLSMKEFNNSLMSKISEMSSLILFSITKTSLMNSEQFNRRKNRKRSKRKVKKPKLLRKLKLLHRWLNLIWVDIILNLAKIQHYSMKCI